MATSNYNDQDVRERELRGAPVERMPYREPRPSGAAERGAAAGGWRETIAGVSTLNVLAGIWLIIAPWVLGYVAGDPKWNDVIFGALVALLALSRLFAPTATRWASALNMLIGAWVFIAAFWLDKSGTAQANDIVLGAIVFVLAAIGLSARPDARVGRRTV
jgi:hypothetical protein